MKKQFCTVSVIFLFFIFPSKIHAQVLIEAESFKNKGGWVVDPQFTDQMGSPFLMAHGLGIPVPDATTEVSFHRGGSYRVFIRTRNWTGSWSDKDAAGKFQLIVNDVPLKTVFGTKGNNWSWQDGGVVDIRKGNNRLSLHDLTGFNGRCDAIVFSESPDFIPAENNGELKVFRRKVNNIPDLAPSAGKFDLVVVGGGVAGTCSALSAARLGLKVALIHDRPVLGGNNSSEVRVHLGGRINLEPYPALGNLVNEIGPVAGGNAQPEGNYEDGRKLAAVLAEKNISLFLNYRATEVEKSENTISAIKAVHTESGGELRFTASLFADCTGDGTIGFLAGADYMTGREGRSEYNEPTAPEIRDNLTMGSSVQWYSEESDVSIAFPDIVWRTGFDENSAQVVKKGE